MATWATVWRDAGALAYADDMILAASTQRGLQVNLARLNSGARRFGLMVNPSNSPAVSLFASGRDKKVVTAVEPLFELNGARLPQITSFQLWKYLGLDFEGCPMIWKRSPKAR